MAEEFLDVLTPEGEQTGTAKPRDEIHADGSWHASVHIWITDGDEVLIQKRSEEKESYPGFYDVAAAGHVRAGETPKGAAVRETKEEIGLSLTEKQLHLLTVQKLCYKKDAFVSNEYNYVYVVLAPQDSWKVRLQKEEVAEICWIPWPRLQSDLEEEAPGYCIDPKEAEQVYEWVQTKTTN